CISFNRESNHNAVYDNTIASCKIGVFLSNTANNSIYNNKIVESQNGIVLSNISNKIYDNEISQAKFGLLFEVRNSNQSGNIASVTSTVPDAKDYESLLADLAGENDLTDVQNPYKYKEKMINSTIENEQATSNATFT
ncbi:MAG: hypothetical protein M3O68_08780, partial [Thermoproteota archaeon]|nr:hypothetical protein [Thermoproteota archaeon]